MSRPLLVVANPRRIEEAMASYRAFGIDIVWLRNYSEHDLEQAFPEALEEAGSRYDPIVVVSDDIIAPPHALKAVIAGWREKRREKAVVTGYAILDLVETRVGLTRRPFPPIGHLPVESDYDFYEWHEVYGKPELVDTWFAPFVLTTAHRSTWLRHGWRTWYGSGCCSDLRLSVDLEVEGTPIYAAPSALCVHLKTDWRRGGFAPLLVGKEPPETVWERRRS